MKRRAYLLLSLFAAASGWLYTVRTLSPWGEYRNEIRDQIRSQMGDLYPRWLGTQELLLRGRNPYGPEVSHEIQKAFYGHAVSQDYSQPGRKVDEQRFAYPLYVVFLLAPTVHSDFANVRRWATLFLGFLTATSILLCLNLLHRRVSWETACAIILFALSSPQIVQGLRFQQLALLVGFLLVAGTWCIVNDHLATAGVLLAFSTIKPQMALLPLCWFAIWCLGGWPKRWRLATSFIVSLLALCSAGELLLRGWIRYFIEGLVAYTKYFPTTSPLRVFLGDTLGEIAGGAIAIGVLVFAWRNKNGPASSREFTIGFASLLVATNLAFPLFTPFNQVLLIFPTLFLLRDWDAMPRFYRVIFVIFVAWPELFSAILLVFPPRLHSLNVLPLLPSLIGPVFPLFLPLMLLTRRRDRVAPASPLDAAVLG